MRVWKSREERYVTVWPSRNIREFREITTAGATWSVAFWKCEIFVIALTSTFNMNTTSNLWQSFRTQTFELETDHFKNGQFVDVSIHCCCMNEVNVVENVF